MKKALSVKKYTARDLAAQFGCSVDTIQRVGNELFGPSKPRVARYFDEAQTTLILARLQNPATAGRQASAATVAADIETEMTLAFQIAEAAKRLEALYQKALDKEKFRAVKAEAALGRLTMAHQDVLSANTQLWDIAESAGALTSDREDMLSTYWRR
jgi:hypothetical protein